MRDFVDTGVFEKVATSTYFANQLAQVNTLKLGHRSIPNYV